MFTLPFCIQFTHNDCTFHGCVKENRITRRPEDNFAQFVFSGGGGMNIGRTQGASNKTHAPLETAAGV